MGFKFVPIQVIFVLPKLPPPPIIHSISPHAIFQNKCFLQEFIFSTFGFNWRACFAKFPFDQIPSLLRLFQFSAFVLWLMVGFISLSPSLA